MDNLLRPLVWLDFRLAVLFTVLIPLGLLIWAFQTRTEVIKRSLIIYWRVSSLLAITVYLMIGSLPISFLTGFAGRLLIPLSLWYWQDLNEDISATRSPLKFWYTAWRWAITAYCVVGTLFGLNFVNCAFMSAERMGDRCLTLLDVPLAFKAMFHVNTPADNLAFAGIVGLIIYSLYLGVFLFFSLPKQGRIAFRD